MRKFSNSAVESVYLSAPQPFKKSLLQLRELILDEAESMHELGGVEETLKWGEPSYLPCKSRVGSTVRVGQFDDSTVALYFNCQTMLVENIRNTYGSELSYSANRAVLFDIKQPIPEAVVRRCTRMALYYHLDKKSGLHRELQL